MIWHLEWHFQDRCIYRFLWSKHMTEPTGSPPRCGAFSTCSSRWWCRSSFLCRDIRSCRTREEGLSRFPRGALETSAELGIVLAPCKPHEQPPCGLANSSKQLHVFIFPRSPANGSFMASGLQLLLRADRCRCRLRSKTRFPLLVRMVRIFAGVAFCKLLHVSSARSLGRRWVSETCPCRVPGWPDERLTYAWCDSAEAWLAAAAAPTGTSTSFPSLRACDVHCRHRGFVLHPGARCALRRLSASSHFSLFLCLNFHSGLTAVPFASVHRHFPAVPKLG